jgi:quercetin 2,3-dioxygenase
MQATDSTARRTVARVEDKIHFGADLQVDDRNVLITPMTPALTDPFLLLSEDWFSTTGFEWHPHRGVETVTLVLDGVLEHGDNLGNAGALTTGDIQWMTAGRGIIHRELAFRNERAHTLQLWVNLPGELKMTGTRYQDLRAVGRPVIERDGARIDVISGDVDGTAGPALNNWPISATLITLEPGRSLEHLLPGRDRAFFYVLSGEVTVASRAVRAGQIAWSDLWLPKIPYGQVITGSRLAARHPFVDDRVSCACASCSFSPFRYPHGCGCPGVRRRGRTLRSFCCATSWRSCGGRRRRGRG